LPDLLLAACATCAASNNRCPLLDADIPDFDGATIQNEQVKINCYYLCKAQ
jgi:hypothetical protein